MTEALKQGTIQHLKHLLLMEQEELRDRVKDNQHFGLDESFKDSMGELSSYDNYPGDAGTETYERGKDLALLELEALHLERVEAALARMETGEYGHCTACGKFIPVERLEALPTAIYCTEHEPKQIPSNDRPVEEEFLYPGFGRTSLDERDDQNGFDGEDTWQILESWGNSNSPAMAENNHIEDYGEMMIDSEENDGYVEPLESFLATDITGQFVSVIRNREYYHYLASNEGDPLLVPDEVDINKD